MIKATTHLICNSLFVIALHSQEISTLQGVVTDQLDQPLEGAVISLLHFSDSTLVKAAISEPNGSFEVATNEQGPFLAMVQMFGYSLYTTDKLNDLSSFLNVKLTPQSVTNAEVVVVGKIPFAEKKIDRMVINPDALISNAGLTALEVLEKSPGVQVDLEGNIKLRGQSGVMVMIDDKQTYLSSSDLASYLRSLPASSIGRIEIMTTPPAKYDAEGSAGVINIVMKRTKVNGLSGGVNVGYSQGYYWRSNDSFHLDYRINKLNFFSNFSYGNNGSYQDLTIRRQYFTDGELNSGFIQRTRIKKRNEGWQGKVGLDYYMNEHSTAGFSVSGFTNTNTESTHNLAEISDSLSSLTGKVNAFVPMKQKMSSITANINYTWKIDSLGQELSMNADYSIFDAKMDQSLLNDTYTPSDVLLLSTNLVSNLPSSIDIATAKIDYSHPFRNHSRFDTGAKTSSIHTENFANFYDEADGELSPNYDFTNTFFYDEQIHAGYVNYSGEKKLFAYQAGLRYENTVMEGVQKGNALQPDSTFKRNYGNFFPTLYLNQKLDSLGKHVIGLSAGRRINRPNYQDMNPFTYPMDRFTLYSGNPFLQPTFSYYGELSYLNNNNYNFTMYAGTNKNEINETIEQTNGIFYSRPGNIGKSTYLGFSVSGAYEVAKWWTIQFYAEYMYTTYSGKLYGQRLDNQGGFFSMNPVNMFTITDKLSAELSGFYRTKIYSSQFVMIPLHTINAGLAYKMMNNKATLRLNINDALYTFQPGGNILSLNESTASWKSYFDSRVFGISFSYKFTKGKVLAARDAGSSDTELERVKK